MTPADWYLNARLTRHENLLQGEQGQVGTHGWKYIAFHLPGTSTHTLVVLNCQSALLQSLEVAGEESNMKRVERSVLSLLQLLLLVFVWQGDSLRPSAHTDGGYVMGRRVAADWLGLHNSYLVCFLKILKSIRLIHAFLTARYKHSVFPALLLLLKIQLGVAAICMIFKHDLAGIGPNSRRMPWNSISRMGTFEAASDIQPDLSQGGTTAFHWGSSRH